MRTGGNNRENGQVLIESVVALTLILVGLLGVLQLVLNSLRLNRDVSSRLVATYLAAEGVEVVKNIGDSAITARVDEAWNSRLIPGQWVVAYDSVALARESECSSLGFNDALGVYNCSRGGFRRKVEVLQPNTDSVSISSTVWWVERSGKEKSVTVEEVFYNWRK